MPSAFRHTTTLGIAVAAMIVAGCGDKGFVNTLAGNGLVSMQDQCDSASFNAALGAGTCVKQGSVTLTAFNDELAATQKVAAWQFVPSAMTISVGQSILATNNGGEHHTFTEVENFGGGIVPALNTASGNPVPAPECTALSSSAQIAPGASTTTDPASTVGTEHYQCCIHPWMRTTVTVIQP
ncbi:MAG: cupredoxin domain-containing protein [bacterium]